MLKTINSPKDIRWEEPQSVI